MFIFNIRHCYPRQSCVFRYGNVVFLSVCEVRRIFAFGELFNGIVVAGTEIDSKSVIVICVNAQDKFVVYCDLIVRSQGSERAFQQRSRSAVTYDIKGMSDYLFGNYTVTLAVYIHSVGFKAGINMTILYIFFGIIFGCKSSLGSIAYADISSVS